MGQLLSAHDQRFSRRDAGIALTIFALALALRLIFLFGAGDRTWPHSLYYEGDAPLFAEWAAALDRGEAFELGLPLHAPAVAYLIHWISPPADLPGGRDFVRVKVVWCAISAATWAVFYLVLRAVADRPIALTAALLGTASFGSTIAATSLNSEALYAFLLVLCVGGAMRIAAGGSYWWAPAWGVVNGAAALTRPEHPLLFFMPLHGCGSLTEIRGFW